MIFKMKNKLRSAKTITGRNMAGARAFGVPME